MPAARTESSATPERASPVRWFGRFQLLKLLGKSERTMAWLVSDPQGGRTLMIVLPRVQPADAAGLELWQQGVQRAARLDHPNLARVLEHGVHEGWPYVLHDPGARGSLAERTANAALTGHEAAALTLSALHGLAFAHEARVVHHDLQPYLLLQDDGDRVRVAGLAVAGELAMRSDLRAETRSESRGPAAAPDASSPLSQRAAAEADLVCLGVLMHGLLTGPGVLPEADVGRVARRLPPAGREPVRLPWTLQHPLAEPLRAIVNRATDRQERQRYHSARTLLRALEGWLRTDAESGGGPIALLGDKLRHAGVLPSLPGGGARAARLTSLEGGRTNELADVVLEDPALAFELLRLVNSAQVRGTQVAGSGPVLTVRRAIAMVGMDGVRHAATALRNWPGPLNETDAAQLQRLIDRCKRAGRTALILRPAGYDGEVTYLVTLMQNLGRLVVHYHFAEEAHQIHHLMQPAPSPREGEPDEPGMSEEGAAFAVLGADMEAIGVAVARHWGLSDAVLHLIHRLPTATAVHTVENDDDMLRTVASCANEAVDAAGLPGPRSRLALQRVAQRYGRALGVGLRELQDALMGQQTAPIAQTMPMPLDEAVPAPRAAAGGRA